MSAGAETESSCRLMWPAAGESHRGGQRGHWGKGEREGGTEGGEEKHQKGERTEKKQCQLMGTHAEDGGLRGGHSILKHSHGRSC